MCVCVCVCVYIYIDKNYTIANAVLCNKEKILSWFCDISYCEIQLFTVESIIELVASVIQEMCVVVDSNPFSSVKERGLLDSLWRYHGNPLGDALILDWQLCPFSAMESWISSLESLALFTPGSSRLEGKPTALCLSSSDHPGEELSAFFFSLPTCSKLWERTFCNWMVSQENALFIFLTQDLF